MKTIKLLFPLVLFSLSFQFPLAQVVTDGLQSYYDFNGDYEDKSGNDLHGIGVDLTATIGMENIPETAFSFNGLSSNIDCDNDDRNISNQLTISAWLKTSSLDRQLFISKYNSVEDKGYFMATEDGHAIIGGRDNSGFFWQAISTSLINDGEWHHVVGIVDENKWQIWVDCFLETEIITQTSTPYLNCTDPLTIGYWFQGNGMGDFRYFDGVLDDIRLYNRPLNSNELDTLCDFNFITSIDQKAIIQEQFNIYPNPANSVLNIESSNFDKTQNLSYLIYNNIGQIVARGQTTVSDQINLLNLSDGQYILHLFSDTDLRKLIFTAKFIKMRA